MSGPHPCALLSPGRLVWLPSHLQAPTQESRPPSILLPGCSQSLSPHISPPPPPPPPQPAPGRGRDLNSNLLPIVLRPKWVPATDPVPPGCPTLRCCPISWASPSTPRLQLPPIARLPSARNACSPPPHPRSLPGRRAPRRLEQGRAPDTAAISVRSTHRSPRSEWQAAPTLASSVRHCASTARPEETERGSLRAGQAAAASHPGCQFGGPSLVPPGKSQGTGPSDRRWEAPRDPAEALPPASFCLLKPASRTWYPDRLASRPAAY